MSEAEVIEAGTDLEQVPTSLFGTNNPTEVIKRASEVADALAAIIKDRSLFTVIGGKAHVHYEGWTTLGAMLGVTPVCEWTRPLEKGWEARVEVRTLDGRTIGAAESMCLTSEKRWAKADDYAVRSMAQTRAASKALASVLRFVVILRGYSGTPAEEMEPRSEPVTEESAELGAAKTKILEMWGEKADKRKMSKAKLTAQLRAVTTLEEARDFARSIPLKENA